MATRKYKDKEYIYDKPSVYLATKLPKDVKRIEAVKNVINDILEGGTYSVLLEKLQKDYYNIDKKYTKSNAESIVKEARAVIKKDFDDYVGNAKEQIWNKALDLYTECKEVGDRATALKALQYVAKLTGIEDIQKVDMNINGNIEIDFGFDE